MSNLNARHAYLPDEPADEADEDAEDRNSFAFQGSEDFRNKPLEVWNSKVSYVTQSSADRDIRPCYEVLLKLANEIEFEGRLSADASLFHHASSD